MDYKCVKQFNRLALDNEIIKIDEGAELACKKGILIYENRPVCYETSAVAVIYFVYDGDNQGTERHEKHEEIYSRMVELNQAYQEAYQAEVEAHPTEEGEEPYIPEIEDKVHDFMETIEKQGYAKLAGFRAYVFTPQFQKATPEELEALLTLLA